MLIIATHGVSWVSWWSWGSHHAGFSTLSESFSLPLGAVGAGEPRGAIWVGLPRGAGVALGALHAGEALLALRAGRSGRSPGACEALNTLLALRTAISHQTVNSSLAGWSGGTVVTLFSPGVRWIP